MQKKLLQKGFTLIELLIVIAIVAILAGVVFVALDPLNRFRDARDSARWTDVTAVLSAIRVAQVDKGGTYVYGIRHDAAKATGSAYLIVTGTTTTDSAACTDDDAVTTAGACKVSLAGCAEMTQLASRGYLGRVPTSSNGTFSWSTQSRGTGYYVRLNANNSVTVGSCEAENAADISVTR
ncbi:MAG: type II secretion system protein [Patescibacteria group bacterium]